MRRRRRKNRVHHRHHRHRARNPFRHRYRHRRRNPIEATTERLSDAIVPAAIGGAGAVGLDVMLAYLPLPATLQTGWGLYLTKIAGSFALGWGAGKVIGERKGHIVAAGALTVSLYTIIRALAQQSLGAQVKGLSGFADFRAYMPRPTRQANFPGTLVKGRRGMPMHAIAAPTSAASPVATKQMSAYMGRAGMGRFR